MTYILRNTDSQESFYFDDYEEMYEWIGDNIMIQDHMNWQVVNSEGETWDL